MLRVAGPISGRVAVRGLGLVPRTLLRPDCPSLVIRIIRGPCQAMTGGHHGTAGWFGTGRTTAVGTWWARQGRRTAGSVFTAELQRSGHAWLILSCPRPTEQSTQTTRWSVSLAQCHPHSLSVHCSDGCVRFSANHTSSEYFVHKPCRGWRDLSAKADVIQI